VTESRLVKEVIGARNAFVKAMLALYDRHEPISLTTISRETGLVDDELSLWLSIMQDENVLNLVPGRSSQFSLFRTHHTVVSVSGEDAPPDAN
jgi:hypothetical protein